MIVDALSRTIFIDNDETQLDYTEFRNKIYESRESMWIWKDEKDGYEDLLRSIGESIRKNNLKDLRLGKRLRRHLGSKLTKLAEQVNSSKESIPDSIAIDPLNSIFKLAGNAFYSS